MGSITTFSYCLFGIDRILLNRACPHPLAADRAVRLCGLLRMDDLDLSVREYADNGHLPLMHDLELPVLLVVLGEQMLFGAADVDDFCVFHNQSLLFAFDGYIKSHKIHALNTFGRHRKGLESGGKHSRNDQKPPEATRSQNLIKATFLMAFFFLKSTITSIKIADDIVYWM